MEAILQQFGLEGPLMLTVSLGFLALLFILAKVAWPAVNKMLDERAAAIKHRLDEAEARRAEMEQMRGDYEQRIGSIETEARERLQAAVREAHAARDELLQHARTQAEQMMERARLEVSHAKEKALMEIRDSVADLSAQAAGLIIQRTLDPAAHRDLVDQVIAGIGPGTGGGPNGGRA